MKIDGIEATAARIRQNGSTTPVSLPRGAKANQKLWKACQGFESLFMSYLVQSMEKTIPEGSLSNKGLTNLMFPQIMGTALSEGGGVGLAEMLYQDLEVKVTPGPAEMETKAPVPARPLAHTDKDEHD